MKKVVFIFLLGIIVAVIGISIIGANHNNQDAVSIGFGCYALGGLITGISLILEKRQRQYGF